MRYIWATLGLLCVGFAIVGIVTPILPTVPFLLLAAYFFSKSSERLHKWLLSHKVFGPLIQDWQDNGVIRPRAKKIATVSITAVFLLSVFIGLRPALLGLQAAILGMVLVFIWSRPSQ